MEGLDKYLTNEPMTNDKWDGLYNIVYADPAWKFRSRLANGNDKNGIVNLKQVKIGDNYTVMTTDDICRLPVKNMTADDAVLFFMDNRCTLGGSNESDKRLGVQIQNYRLHLAQKRTKRCAKLLCWFLDL